MATQPDWLLGAIERAGGKAIFADSIGMNRAMLSHILAGRRSFPAKYALKVEGLFGVSRHIIAPSFYCEDDSQPGGQNAARTS